ncbi:hypothetical protein GF312_07895 [Candidatus Poribacteria bacterium]|nr:hypothetical protein [Candidatus Poribacteria bacterium]
MPYDLIDKIHKQRKKKNELIRLETFSQLEKLLEKLSNEYGFSQAYIFGSLVKPGKFREDSDIDIAICGLENKYFFRLISVISREMLRDVDLCQMERATEGFRDKILKQGVLWKKKD